MHAGEQGESARIALLCRATEQLGPLPPALGVVRSGKQHLAEPKRGLIRPGARRSPQPTPPLAVELGAEDAVGAKHAELGLGLAVAILRGPPQGREHSLAINVEPLGDTGLEVPDGMLHPVRRGVAYRLLGEGLRSVLCERVL